VAPEPSPEQHGAAHPAQPDAARTPATAGATDRTVLRSVANPRRTRLV
jgi:hypothetical protein